MNSVVMILCVGLMAVYGFIVFFGERCNDWVESKDWFDWRMHSFIGRIIDYAYYAWPLVSLLLLYIIVGGAMVNYYKRRK